MNRPALLAFAVLLFSAAAARAYIGETPQQLDARWGAPVSITRYYVTKYVGQERTYVFRDLKIIATIWRGESHREIYVRNRSWRDQEIRQATAANSSQWGIQVISATPSRVTWTFGENLYAAYNDRKARGSFLTVSTSALARAESMRTREEWFWRY